MATIALGVALMLVLTACQEPLSTEASGEVVYRVGCASCHGADLEGGRGPALDAGSEAADRGDAYYLQTITRGNGRMPAVRGFTEEQIERVIGYIRTRQGGS